jgi:ribosomal protein S18 acetylase RimI-like enzyme
MDLRIRRIQLVDAGKLMAFYNGLSAGSKRTFRPLGDVTTLDACIEIARDNRPEVDKRFDLIALDAGQVIGWSFIWDLQSDEPTFGLGVADAHHGRGLGGELMDRVMRAARERTLHKVYLTVVQDNSVAWRMYQRRGFVRYGEFVGQDGQDYYRMVAELAGKLEGSDT